MKRIFRFLPIALMGMLILAGCKKEGFETFSVTTQPYNGQEKVYIDNDYACWSSGDAVKINSTTATVTVTNTGSGSKVELTGVPTAENYYAIYPASACGGTFASGASITLPRTQNYVEANGVQVISAPMAAKANGSNVMNFKNLCALLKVHLDQANNKIVAIEIRSADSSVALSGSGVVTFDGSGNPSLGSLSGNKRVSLNFSVPMSLNVTGGKDFYIAIPEVAHGKVLQVFTKDIFNQYKLLPVTTQQTIPCNTILGLTGPDVPDNDAYEFYDWVRSDGSGYIDLGVQPTVDARMEMTYMIVGTITHSQYLCGSRGKTDDALDQTQWLTLGGASGDASNGFYVGVGEKAATFKPGWNPAIPVRERNVKYKLETTLIAVDGYLKVWGRFTVGNNNWSRNSAVSSISSTLPATRKPVYVFGWNETNLHDGLKCYSFKYYTSGGNLEYDFIPCQEKEGSHRIGMYDMVHANFHPVTQTGATPFSVGND